MTSAEQLYQIFHKETNLVKGINVRLVQNFDNIKSSKYWPFFESASNLINRNNGHIDATLYIRSLAIFFKGWFNPEFLTSRKSITIYKNYLEQQEQEMSEEFIKSEIVRSVKFIAQFCIENNLNELSDYLSHDINMIPTLMKHIVAGSISYYYLACLDSLLMIIDSYPQDAKDDYLPNFEQKLNIFRSRIIYNNIQGLIPKNIENITNELIQKLRKEKISTTNTTI